MPKPTSTTRDIAVARLRFIRDRLLSAAPHVPNEPPAFLDLESIAHHLDTIVWLLDPDEENA